MSLRWIAKFLGMNPKEIYDLNKAGLGPKATKVNNSYVVTRKSLIVWLATRKDKGGK